MLNECDVQLFVWPMLRACVCGINRGAYFGEFALMKQINRSASVLAKTRWEE